MENKYRFRDSSLSFDERVKDLLSRLTIKEKAGLMSSHMAAVPRLDIGEWYVGAEVARGYVSRNPDEPTTVFPQPIGPVSYTHLRAHETRSLWKRRDLRQAKRHGC